MSTPTAEPREVSVYILFWAGIVVLIKPNLATSAFSVFYFSASSSFENLINKKRVKNYFTTRNLRWWLFKWVNPPQSLRFGFLWVRNLLKWQNLATVSGVPCRAWRHIDKVLQVAPTMKFVSNGIVIQIISQNDPYYHTIPKIYHTLIPIRNPYKNLCDQQ